METRLTKHQIIDETVDYYNNNPRSIRTDYEGASSCYYYHPDNNIQCAFSRCTKEEFKDKLIEQNESTVTNALSNLMLELDSILQDKYKGHDISFWEHIQRIHDKDSYWTNSKLNSSGIAFVNELKEKYKN